MSFPPKALARHPRLVTRQRVGRVVPAVLGVASLVVCVSAARGEIPFEREPISYLTATPHDPVARLQEALQSRKVELKHDDSQGYLRSVLARLDVPVSSQV